MTCLNLQVTGRRKGSPLIHFILRRLLLSIPVLFGILLLTFGLARAIPGDPRRAILGERATDQICEEFERRNGLDQPLPLQFLVYLRNAAQGDPGDSFRFRPPDPGGQSRPLVRNPGAGGGRR
ncbi:MAG: ABC transporter permease [Anaerolineaceae bacterium]|nr:ABC transporter permease [Anaerolineaceae bacterium]